MKIPIADILIDHDLNVSRDPLTASDCQDLAVEIDEDGLITPVLVRPIDHPEYKYKLVAGYRRMIAVGSILGHYDVEAYVRGDINGDEEAKRINLSENLNRNDLSYWEQCNGIRRAFEAGTPEVTIVNALRRSRTWVRCRWLVWKMPQEVIDQVQEGLLSVTQVGLLIHKSYDEQADAALKMRKGTEEGETTNSMLHKFSNRKSKPNTKAVQATMTRLMDLGKMDGVHYLRYTLGEISDTQLYELIK